MTATPDVSEPIDQLQDPRRLPKPEGSGRLVEDDELRGERHGSRDRHCLALAPGHQCDVGIEVRQPDLQTVEKVLGAGGHLLLLHPRRPRGNQDGPATSRPAKKFAVGLRLSNRAEVLVDGLDPV